MPEQTPWKTREDFVKLKVGKRQIGKGNWGKVFLGKIWLKGQRPKRVAVKVFEPAAAMEYFGKPEMDDEAIGHYEEAISRLRRAGVPVLRTGFVKHEGKWVQVQHLFAVSRGSKINDIRDVSKRTLRKIVENENTRREFFDLIGKIINAGFIPHSDTIGIAHNRVVSPSGEKRGLREWFGRVKEKLRKPRIRFVVHDLDFFAHLNWMHKKLGGEQRVNLTLPHHLGNIIRFMTATGMTWKEVIAELRQRVKTRDGLSAIDAIDA